MQCASTPTLQSIAETLGISPQHTSGGDLIFLESDIRIWVPRKFLGAMSDNFINISGEWEDRKICLEIREHAAAEHMSDSETDELAQSYVSLSKVDSTSLDRFEATSSFRIGNGKRRTVLEGRMQLLKMITQGSSQNIQKTEVEIDTLDAVTRFEVPTKRSIPFLLTAQELQQYLREEGEWDSSDSRSSNTLTTTTSSPTANSEGRAAGSTGPMSPESPTSTTQSSSMDAGSPSHFTTVAHLSKTAMNLSKAAGANLQAAVKKTIQTSNRIVFTWGTIGMKWQDSRTGLWTYIAFRSVEDCFRWTSTVRKVMVSQLYFQTFREPAKPPLTRNPERPDLKPLVDIFEAVKPDESKKKSNPRAVPNDGIITFVLGERRNKWKVFLDSKAVPNCADKSVPQIIHCAKMGKTVAQAPSNKLLGITRVHANEQDIDLRHCTIHVPMPFSSQLFLHQEDSVTKVVRRLEIQAASMENRIVWEEWFQTFGAVKVLSAEEQTAKDHIMGEDDDLLDDNPLLPDDDVNQDTAKMVRGKSRRLRSNSMIKRSPPSFSWTGTPHASSQLRPLPGFERERSMGSPKPSSESPLLSPTDRSQCTSPSSTVTYTPRDDTLQVKLPAVLTSSGGAPFTLEDTLPSPKGHDEISLSTSTRGTGANDDIAPMQPKVSLNVIIPSDTNELVVPGRESEGSKTPSFGSQASGSSPLVRHVELDDVSLLTTQENETALAATVAEEKVLDMSSHGQPRSLHTAAASPEDVLVTRLPSMRDIPTSATLSPMLLDPLPTAAAFTRTEVVLEDSFRDRAVTVLCPSTSVSLSDNSCDDSSPSTVQGHGKTARWLRLQRFAQEHSPVPPLALQEKTTNAPVDAPSTPLKPRQVLTTAPKIALEASPLATQRDDNSSQFRVSKPSYEFSTHMSSISLKNIQSSTDDATTTVSPRETSDSPSTNSDHDIASLVDKWKREFRNSVECVRSSKVEETASSGNTSPTSFTVEKESESAPSSVRKPAFEAELSVICPLCNKNKRTAEICDKTGRKHVISAISKRALGVPSVNNEHSLSFKQQQRRDMDNCEHNSLAMSNRPTAFSRFAGEPPEVTAARIFLELN